ncbi:hypothetical protein C4578_00825 [Candidatus Microgenomates bacterium]|jgi:hypothetical protein|nr:MAG: hypothetical protein C4578_00825 [Candidatus Microgenomates bacterium]
MGINTKIAKIPFFILYLTLAGLTSFNWVRVILFQKDFGAFRTTQPWDYYLSRFFSSTFGISQQQYFILAFPVVLICLYLIPKLFGKLMSTDKSSNVKGDNHVAATLILLTAPSILSLPIALGIILIVLFSIWSWMDEQKAKKKT